MHWENHKLALPRLPKGMRWVTAFETEENEAKGGSRARGGSEELLRNIPPRSIAVFVSAFTEQK